MSTATFTPTAMPHGGSRTTIALDRLDDSTNRVNSGFHIRTVMPTAG